MMYLFLIMNESRQIHKAIKPLIKKGYNVTLVYSIDGVDVDSISGGDCNCSHPKYYDPKDGHGFTLIYMDDFIDIEGSDYLQNTSINILRRMIRHLEEIEGQPLPKQDK